MCTRSRPFSKLVQFDVFEFDLRGVELRKAALWPRCSSSRCSWMGNEAKRFKRRYGALPADDFFLNSEVGVSYKDQNLKVLEDLTILSGNSSRSSGKMAQCFLPGQRQETQPH